MLNSDSRVQAKEFQRDYTVASTIKGVGDYAIGVTKPVPVSQTSMGRLAQSLGAASGLLKEFSDYQIQKDQLDLQSAALEGKIATQEIAGQKALIELENSKLRGSITNETIKQQNMRLDMLKQQEIVAEFDSMFEGMTEEQKVNFEIGVAENAKKAEEEADKALGKAAVVTAKTGTEKEQQTFKEIYAKRRKGAGLFNAYDEYFKSEATKRLSAISEENITAEQANAIGQDIQNSFIEMSNLEEGSEELKGFLIATTKYNQKNMASLATNAKEKAKAIGSERLIFSIADTTKTSDTLDESQLAELRIKADEGTLRTFLTAKDGIINSIINLRDPEAIDNLADILQEQLSDLPIGDGRTLKETLYYEASLSDLDEAETKLLAEERNEKNLKDEIGGEDFANFTFEALNFLKATELGNTLSAVATEVSNSEGTKSYRDVMLERFPEQLSDSINKVFDSYPEDKLDGEFQSDFFRLSEAVIADKHSQANKYIKKNTKNDVNLSEPKYAEELFIDIKSQFDAIKGDGSNESAFLKKFLNDPVTGAGLGLSEYRMAQFDRMTADGKGVGVFEQYKKAREALPDLVKESYDPASDDAKEFLNLEIEKYNERLKSGIKSFVEGRVRRKAEITQEGAFGFIGKEKVEALINQNPFLPIPEIREIIEKQREDELKASKAERRRLDPEFESKLKDLRSPEKLFETNEKIREVLLGNDLRDRKSEAFTSLSKAAGELFYVKEGNPFLFNIFGLMDYDKDRKEAVDNYTRLHAQAEQSQQVRMKTGVTAKEILDIAQTAATLPDAELVGNELIIPLIAREDSFNFRDIASPFYYGYPTGERYFSDKDDYDKIMLAARELRDITVPKSFFAKTNPPLRDLKLGDKGSSSFRIKEADVNKAMKDLEMTEDQLLDIAELYGHKDIVSFLRAQYDTPYHRNQRK